MAGNGPDSQIDVAMRRALDASVGAAVIGRRTLDLGVGPGAARRGPVCPALWSRIGRCLDPLGDNGGTFAFDGLQAAVQRAEQAAGDNDVLVLGVDVARQLLTAAVLGELRLHLVPLLLGAGTPLFEGGSRPN